jgi:transcriptional regulator with XRE-family HTH domain
MNNFSWQFGERFRQIRRMTRLTQDEFGKLLGVSRQTINAYENDRQRPTLDMMEKVCREQGISPRWLLTGVGDPKAGVAYSFVEHGSLDLAVSEGSMSPEQLALMNFIMEDQGRAVKLARYLLDEALRNLRQGGGTDIPSEDAA